MAYKGFDEEKFIEYLDNTYYGLENSMFRGTISNIIEYGHKYNQVSKDMFCEFVSNMIDEVTFGEVAMFMEDKCLTENGIKEKNKWLAYVGGENG